MSAVEISRRRFVRTSALALSGVIARPAGAQGQKAITVVPKSRPPARTLYAFRASDLTSWSWDLRLALSCLQGIANRAQPQLYLIHDRYDELWLDWLRERGDIDKIEWPEIGQVFERFLPSVSQMFVTDPTVPASVNVATMLAAVRGGLVATPAIADQFSLPMGVSPDSSATGLDLRTFRWKKDLDAYKWAYQQLGEQLSRQAVAILAPEEVALRDYLVEFKIPILWISGPQDEERNPKASSEEELKFARDILMQWPPNIPCLGWPTSGDKLGGIGETPGVRLTSQCAKYSACTAFDAYSPTVGNLSVHSGTSATFRQNVPAVKLDRAKVYLAFIRSDGDGWNFHRHYYRKLFDDPQHGSVPIGWQISGSAVDGQPDILDYYYRHARPGDCFLNALTGLGYIHEEDYAANYPPAEREQIWRDYVRASDAYRKRLDATVMATYAEMRPERLDLLAERPGLSAIFANYGRSRITTFGNLVTVVGGVPVFRAIDRPPGPFTFTPSARRDAVYYMVNEIKRWTPPQRPAFLHVFLANWLTSLDMAEGIVKGLGSEYVPVRPDQLGPLYQQSRSG
ncbi:MAG TPA: GxGYxYP domain-containing protein [Bryobacteraceae bacterium]|nr:GxGYxYP domain-containing protein [Bryobacteraceae bacterium]